MRNQHPVFLGEQMPIWQVFRYEDVSTVMTDYAHFSSRSIGGGGSLLADTLIAKDPPDHRKLRNLVNLAFTPRAVARLSGRIAAITQELLDGVPARGASELASARTPPHPPPRVPQPATTCPSPHPPTPARTPSAEDRQST